MTPEEIGKRLEKAKAERLQYEPMFNDCIRLTMPGRRRFNEETFTGAGEDIYDETGANAVEEFASRMQAGLFPQFSRFVKLQAGSEVPKEQRRAVNAKLEEVEDKVFEAIWASNFAQESSEALFDLAISTGMMSVEDSGRAWPPIVNRALPITGFFLERSSDDSLGGVFFERKVKGSDLAAMYRVTLPEGSEIARAVREAPDQLVTVVEYLHRDPFAAVESHVHYVAAGQNREIIRQKKLVGRGTSPLLPFRWATAAGETWGRGPLLRALAAIRTTNLTVELILENAAMAIVGMFQTDNEGVLNAENLQLLPGTILSKEIGTDGLQPINLASNAFNVSDLVLSDQRLNIKRALYNDMLADPGKTPATATEVAERMADLAYRTAAGFARVHYEFVVPYIWRVIRILEDRKEIELPTLDSKMVQIVPTSPLAQAQKGRDVQRLLEDYQVRASIFGPQVASAAYRMNELHNWMIERMGLDEGIYESPEKLKQTLAEMARQAQAAQAAAEGAGGQPGALA